MNKRIILFGSFLTCFLMLMMPMIHSTYSFNNYKSSISSTRTFESSKMINITLYNFYESHQEKIDKTISKKKMDDIHEKIAQIEKRDISRFEKINLTFDVFIEHNILSKKDKKINFKNNFEDIMEKHFRSNLLNSSFPFQNQGYSKKEIGGIFGTLYGSFTSDFDDEGYACLSIFPLFCAFPMIFGGFGHGDIYFTGFNADDGLSNQEIIFNDFVFLISLFFVGTVILLPFLYFGYEGYILGLSAGFWGAGI